MNGWINEWTNVSEDDLGQVGDDEKENHKGEFRIIILFSAPKILFISIDSVLPFQQFQLAPFLDLVGRPQIPYQ